MVIKKQGNEQLSQAQQSYQRRKQPVASDSQASARTVLRTPGRKQKGLDQFLGWEDPLEKGMATYSSILAWRILWTVEPGRLQSMGS